jgi:hypothetical protein
MIPDDTDWFDNSGNEEITHDWTNAVQLSMDTMIGSTSDMTYPAPTGTTLSWGGMKVLFWQYNTGIVAGADKVIDAVFDYRNRVIKIVEGGGYNAADRMPGEATWSGVGGMSYDHPLNTNTALYTEDGATNGDPPGVPSNYLTLDAGPNYFIYADSGNNGALTFKNGHATDTIYPFLVLLVSDQFPTRT